MDIQNEKNKFNLENYKISAGLHKQKNVIWIRFDYNPQLIKKLKSYFKNIKWSATQKAWYLPDNTHYRKLCDLEEKIVGKEVLSKIHEINLPEFQKFIDKLTLKGYSPHTIRTYSIEFAQLLYLLKGFSVRDLSADKLQSYFLYCHKKLKLSENYIHSRINAVKFYFEKVLHREKMFFDIPRPKKPLQLPKSLNTKEIKKLFDVTENLKHLVILKLCYGMGLRVSEIVNIKISDIDSQQMKVLISRGKGKKDRYVNLPESVLKNLREYYKSYKPKEYLFEGMYGKAYSIRSTQQVFRNAMKKAGIRKKVGIHGLRHSYATHLLEYGTDISIIQKLLGHSDIKTTLNYTQVTNQIVDKVKSPLDRIIEHPKEE